MVNAGQSVRNAVNAVGEGKEFTIASIVRVSGVSRQTVAKVLRGMVKSGDLLSEMRPYRRHILQEVFIKPISIPRGYIAFFNDMDVMVCDDGRFLTQTEMSNGVLVTNVLSGGVDPVDWVMNSGVKFRTATDAEMIAWFENAGLLNQFVEG